MQKIAAAMQVCQIIQQR
uniref:Uncharacterized protein n=1 Tax=Anguilla anguilla TaxID=7936 RepID=A0A0E9V0T3_ANGAN